MEYFYLSSLIVLLGYITKFYSLLLSQLLSGPFSTWIKVFYVHEVFLGYNLHMSSVPLLDFLQQWLQLYVYFFFLLISPANLFFFDPFYFFLYLIFMCWLPCLSSVAATVFRWSHPHFWDGLVFFLHFFPEFNSLFTFFSVFFPFLFLIFDPWFKIVLHIMNVCLLIHLIHLDHIIQFPFASWLHLREKFQQLTRVDSHFSHFSGNFL